MNITYKTPEAEQNHIAYETAGNKITLGDDELTLNLSRYEQDDPKHVDICVDATDCLVIGTSTGRKYVAEIDIPARQYIEEQGEYDEDRDAYEITRTPVPFDIDTCTLTLWAID